MAKEHSYIKEFSENTLGKYGLNLKDQELIDYLVNRAIYEKLYTDTKDFQHDLKHVERVITYARMIMHQRPNSQVNEMMMMYAALYHDIGKTVGSSNREHGIVGANEFRRRMEGKMPAREIDMISMLIMQHAEAKDKIDFESGKYTPEEMEQLQEMSDILKDADALDRNRLNYPFPIGGCDIERLRLPESKKIHALTDSFYEDYCAAIIKRKEQQTGEKIYNNYQLMDQWITNPQNDEMLYHASLDPSIDQLLPRESTQKGSFVYAGKNPVNCVTMAAFRFSLLFPRTRTADGKRAIKEIFPNTIEQTLSSKYITIYQVPKNQFSEYKAEATAAPTGEWVSSTPVEPIAQVSFKALDLLNDLQKKDRLRIIADHSTEAQLDSFIKGMEVYIWGIKHSNSSPDYMEQKWQQSRALMNYYSQNDTVLQTMDRVREDIDQDIQEYTLEFEATYGRKPNYDNEAECVVPILKKFQKKYYILDPTGKTKINNAYVNSLGNQEKINQESRQK